MNDILVLLWIYKRHKGDLLERLICYFTKSKIVHAGLSLDGHTYDMIAGGLRVSPKKLNADIVLAPKVPLTEAQRVGMWKYIVELRAEEPSYNVPKLVVLGMIYAVRYLCDKIGWVPFSDVLYGEVCSTLVDKAFKAAGIDLLPDRLEDYTSPADFLFSPALEEVHG